MGAVDVQRVENRDRVRNPRGQRVAFGRPWLVATALAAVIGEDQAKLITQRLRKSRRFRNLERIREARVEEDGRSAASRVLEIDTDTIQRVRGVGRSALPRGGRLSTYTLTSRR